MSDVFAGRRCVLMRITAWRTGYRTVQRCKIMLLLLSLMLYARDYNIIFSCTFCDHCGAKASGCHLKL